MGIISAEQEHYGKVFEAFDKLILSDAIDSPKGLWFKALIYLKQGNKDQAKLVLQELLNDSSQYKRKEVEELLRKIA